MSCKFPGHLIILSSAEDFAEVIKDQGLVVA